MNVFNCTSKIQRSSLIREAVTDIKLFFKCNILTDRLKTKQDSTMHYIMKVVCFGLLYNLVKMSAVITGHQYLKHENRFVKSNYEFIEIQNYFTFQ